MPKTRACECSSVGGGCLAHEIGLHIYANRPRDRRGIRRKLPMAAHRQISSTGQQYGSSLSRLQPAAPLCYTRFPVSGETPWATRTISKPIRFGSRTWASRRPRFRVDGGPGISGSSTNSRYLGVPRAAVDLDAFNGTLHDLQTMAGYPSV